LETFAFNIGGTIGLAWIANEFSSYSLQLAEFALHLDEGVISHRGLD
jgi:hypothetical protein